MASIHKMKRTEQSLWRRNSQTMPRGENSADAPPPLVVSDILPQEVGNPTALVETPVSTPTPPLRALNSNLTTGPALKRKALATSDKILQAQKDWENKQRTSIENQGSALQANNHTPPANSLDLTRPPKKDGIKDMAAQAMARAQQLSEEALMQRMTELNRSASASSRAPRASRSHIVESSTSASASASASPSGRLPATDHVDSRDNGNGDGSRTGLQVDADNVSYYFYTEDDGTVQNTKGAPFPPGKERYDDAGHDMKRPFICPVRECRALAVSMKHIAAHFHGKHSRSLFNDNGDGTISRIAAYVNKGDSSPGIIVSRNPLSKGAPPPATPEYSESQKKLLSKKSPPISKMLVPRGSLTDASKRSLRAEMNNDIADERMAKRLRKAPVPLSAEAPVLPSPSPPPLSQSLEPPLTEALQFLHRFLSPSQQVPSRPDVIALSKCDRIRNLPASWIDYHIDKTLDPLHYACVLAYLVGTAEEKNPCRKWKGVSRLSDPCVGLPPNLPAEARAAFSETETCIACRYQFCCYRTKNECEWAKKENSLALNGKTEEAEAASRPKHESASDNKFKVVVVDDDSTGEDEDDDEEEADIAANSKNYATPPLATRQMYLSKKELEQVAIRNSYKKSPPAIPTAVQTPATAQKLSTTEMELMEEMEDWEVAPGTIKDEKTNMNIGFSNAYMSDQHPITISPGLSFNVLILKPGHTYHWPEETSKVRTCSVSAGKINVKTGINQTFKLGPNGVVVIRPGQSCMVANRLYADAVLHCTTFEDDFLPK